MEHVFEFALPVALFIVVAYVIKFMLEAKTRHKLIEKGMVDENVKHLFQHPKDTRLSSLKWGMILVGVGIALPKAGLLICRFHYHGTTFEGSICRGSISNGGSLRIYSGDGRIMGGGITMLSVGC